MVHTSTGDLLLSSRHRLQALLARKRARDLALRLDADREGPIGPVAESAHGRRYDATASPRRYERKKRKRDAECRFLAPVPPNGVPRDPRRRPRKRTKTN